MDRSGYDVTAAVRAHINHGLGAGTDRLAASAAAWPARAGPGASYVPEVADRSRDVTCVRSAFQFGPASASPTGRSSVCESGSCMSWRRRVVAGFDLATSSTQRGMRQ